MRVILAQIRQFLRPPPPGNNRERRPVHPHKRDTVDADRYRWRAQANQLQINFSASYMDSVLILDRLHLIAPVCDVG
jgi:hypothetical protein